jgi:transcriptional regulator with XRE-family HTH domain
MGGNLHIMQYLVNDEVAYHAVEGARKTCEFRRMRINLAKFRERLGLTLEEMAERIDASDSQLSRWEKGKSNIPSKRLPELAKAYQCRVSEIFGEDNEIDETELTPDQLTEMVRIAQGEMQAGIVFADYPRAVATSLHEQLRQIQSAGGVRVSSAQARPVSKGARSPRPSSPGEQG